MISLYHTTDNPYSLYGIHHFIEKSGIPVEINKPSSSGIVISYGGKPQGSYVISVQENEIQNLICGNISQESYTIPVCEIPQETGMEDEVIASFKNGAS